jgi:hypothetical protein
MWYVFTVTIERGAGGSWAGVSDPGVTLVYLVYGPRRLVLNGVFSALTFLRAARDLVRPWRFAIYTDQPELFRRYGIEHDLIALSALRDESADGGYMHRSKMAAIHHAATNYAGSLFYVDADTYFTHSPAAHFAALSPTRSIMHKAEYLVDTGTRPHLHAALRDTSFHAPALRSAQRRGDVVMWNAGTLGIAEANKRLIPDVLVVADELYSVYRYHLVEQLAWALVFADVGDIAPADDLVYHYWFGQEEITHRVARFLSRIGDTPTTELAERAYGLRPRATPGWRPPRVVRARIAARALRQRYRALRAGPGSDFHDKFPEPQDEVTLEIKRQGGAGA